MFQVDGIKHRVSLTSLNILTQQNWLRRGLAKVALSKHFDRFIMLCIVSNSLLLASKEYQSYYDPLYESQWNKILGICDLVFTLIFITECLFKVIVMGFVRHKRAYLSDHWNKFDFLIVVSSLINFIPKADSDVLQSLRTLRTLRPLRSIGFLKTMKVLLENIFKSIPGLFNVCVFLSFMFGLFAIFGTVVFSGSQYSFCRLTEEMIDDGVNQPYWPINEDAEWLCYNDQMCSGAPNFLGDEVVAKCGNILLDYQLDPRIYDNSKDLAIIGYDISNFNDLISSTLNVFQIVTLEGWTDSL